jgi:two-component system chemotaxis family response regulator WspR
VGGHALSTYIAVAFAALAAWLAWQVRALRTSLQAASDTFQTQANELESARMQLQRLSTEDGLTALANHEQFLEFVEREWRRARRDGMPISLVFIDVDHFRSYNRQFGRLAGDECLRRVGQALEKLAGRAGDLIARYHRDEFAAVLAATDLAGAERIAERVRETVEGLQIPAAREAERPYVTVSVSVATAVPSRESEWEELDLIKAARHALRDARAAGGNQVQRAPSPTASAPSSLIADAR